MNIIILTIIATALGFGFTLSKPINTSVGFDIYTSQRSYQNKIDNYLAKKIDKLNYNEYILPVFESHPIKNEISKQTLEISLAEKKEVIMEEKGEKVISYNTKIYDKSSRIYINSKGYWCTKKTHHPLHRLIMSKKMDRQLKRQEVIHHIDGNKLNNKLSNLKLCDNQAVHEKIHKNNLMKYGSWHPPTNTYNIPIKSPVYV